MPDVRTTDPSSGRDLLLPSGRPWGIPLCTVATSAGYGLLKNMLLREQLVTPATLDASLHLRVSFQKNTRQIHSLDEPFYVGFSKCRDYEVVGDGGVRIIFQGGRQWFSDDRDKSKIGLALVDRLKPHSIFKPYKGSAMCRFVRSTLPEHADMRALLLQVVTIIEPAEAVSPDYDGYVPMPCEGQLCHVGGRIWSCILDKNHATAALQALCDRDW
ncbi:hypothetical protein B0H21DRAFT_827383 [Amylocystis lapponica]|nr:hypothetical protein B0H21DRAFT_827383 [Amylocystis lapponica]